MEAGLRLDRSPSRHLNDRAGSNSGMQKRVAMLSGTLIVAFDFEGTRRACVVAGGGVHSLRDFTFAMMCCPFGAL
ncbi:MAG: hypothetical protein R3C19_23230 [Planctomycetaceae bacterium]